MKLSEQLRNRCICEDHEHYRNCCPCKGLDLLYIRHLEELEIKAEAWDLLQIILEQTK